VVDGRLYLCEAKSSAGLDKFQIDQLFDAASRIRPDVLLISCMDKLTPSLKAAGAELQSRLGSDIRVDLMEISPDAFGKTSFLPG
jgi:hypothetical protein